MVEPSEARGVAKKPSFLLDDEEEEEEERGVAKKPSFLLDDDEEEEPSSSLELARILQQEEVDNQTAANQLSVQDPNYQYSVSKFEQELYSFQVAKQLQEQYEQNDLYIELCQADKEEEEDAMHSTTMGKAWKIVSQVLSVVEDEIKKQKEQDEIKKKKKQEQEQYWMNGSSSSSTNANTLLEDEISAIAADDLFFQAHAMLTLQEEFHLAGKPTKVDLGFHYTRKENLSRIRTDGLLTKSDRDARNIVSQYNGSTYGDGVYTADDHSHGISGRYGDVGIIVARLQGEPHIDCHIVNKSSKVVVLKQSSQCLALMKFPRSLYTSTILVNLQNAFTIMIERYMNPVVIEPVRKTELVGSCTSSEVEMLNPFSSKTLKKTIHYTAPVGWDPYVLTVEELQKVPKKETTCFAMPSGTMSVEYSPILRCRGHQSMGTYVIMYTIPNGIQKSYHENPGQPHAFSSLTAYVPVNAEGCNLLKRLQCAFEHGATFTVGTSKRRRKSNQVILASIPHKTSLVSGQYGFPDPFYFDICNTELDKLGIPRADTL